MFAEWLRRVGGAAGYTSLALIAAGCGDGSSTGPAVTSTSTAPAPTSTPSPTPSPTATGATTADGTLATAVVVQSGDSIGSGYVVNWAAFDHLGLASSVVVHNVSVPGISMQAGFGQRETDLFPFEAPNIPSVLVIQQGTNDIAYGSSATTLYNNVLDLFIGTAHAAGFYVVVDTLLPRSDPGWTDVKEQERLRYNTLVRANSSRADAINDIAADSVMGDGSDPTTSPYYADALHPSLLGQQRLATLDAAAIAPFLQRPARGH
jgi:hypothetical protein